MTAFKRISGFLLIISVLAFLAIQFFQIDKAEIGYDHKNSYEYIAKPPKDVKNLLADACADCHTSKANYPWYSSVQPFGWWIQDHIEHGRKHLNFSEWGNMDKKERVHAIEEIIETLEEKEMPLKEYTWLHKEARLSEAQVNMLVEWFSREHPAH